MNSQPNLRRGCIAAILSIMFTPVVATACSCVITASVCDVDWKRGEVIFLGKVTARDSIPNPLSNSQYTLPAQVAVRFSVTESFRGVGLGPEIVVYTGNGGGDCGYPFIVGNAYLVYAQTYENQLTTSICSQTRPQVMVAGSLKQLRALRDGVQGASLFGTIGIGPRGVGYEDLIESKGLSGVRVRAIGSTPQDYSATTNEQGAYSFYWLPADTYRLEVDLPAGLSVGQANAGKPLTIQVSRGDEATGCRADMFARPDGQISGVVVDSAGKGLAGFVTIKPADAKEAAAALRRGGLPGYTTEDGKFSLMQIPPGRYQLQFYQKVNGQVSFARGATRSEVIDLGLGQHIENFQFKVPTSPTSNSPP
jgi:hypothetical protein